MAGKNARKSTAATLKEEEWKKKLKRGDNKEMKSEKPNNRKLEAKERDWNRFPCLFFFL